MAEYPALPIWTDAYIADTQHLTNEEHGVYFKLLMFAWRRSDCSLPDDDKRLALMVGVTPKVWASMKPTIMEFWELDGPAWRQKKLTNTRRAVSKSVEQKRAAGIASANAKRLKSKEPPPTAVATDVVTADTTARQLSKTKTKVEGGGEDAGARAVEIANNSPPAEARGLLLSAIGVDPISGMTGRGGGMLGKMSDMAEFERWRGLGLTIDEICAIIAEVMAKKQDGPPHTFTYFSGAMQRFAGDKQKPELLPDISRGNDHANNRRGPATGTHTAGAARRDPVSRGLEGLHSGFSRAIHQLEERDGTDQGGD